ncbi:hypothetical protein KI387_013697 [Taxus chinensis]|uniref:Uncharacterized protein n=1 Tax=Taxus chinensis TaxID=29808 RepID=A0AA38CT75_TAXCH|nr:hypothetical protein KI387_013697 [Taxus chinensis]
MESFEGHRGGSSQDWLCWPSVLLAGLRPIRVRNLQVGQRHQGCVLFGTLCADALRVPAIVTILEDQFGDAIRVAIHNPPESSRSLHFGVLYPKGSMVAVKEPYSGQGDQDGMLMLRVDNPRNVEIVTSFPPIPQTSFVEHLLDLRGKASACFRADDWEKSIEYYSRCIQFALSSYKSEPRFPWASNIQKQVMEALLCSYCDRAKAMLKLNKHYNAVEDFDKALEIDHNHPKALFPKGRVFHSLGEYKLACQCFERALQGCPTANDIRLQYEKSKELNNQNENGMFDLSPYFLNGCKPQDVPELSNYIGPVLNKKSAGRGRGLFATANVDVGDFLVVDNAVAFSCTENITENIRHVSNNVGYVKQDLEAKITCSAASSNRILQQLQYLAKWEEMKVPPMDLFRINLECIYKVGSSVSSFSVLTDRVLNVKIM